MTAGSRREPLEWIYIAKGLAIILVTVGHFYPVTSPPYWVTFREMLYLFLTQTFFLLSGYLYHHGKHAYGDVVKNKIERLGYPFFSIALVFFAIKFIAGQFVALDYPVTLDSVVVLLTYPAESFVRPLWFIHALFLVFLLYPLLRSVMGTVPILVVSLLVNTIFGTHYPVVNEAMANLPFFAAGALLREKSALTDRMLGAGWGRVFLPLIPFLVVFAMLGADVILQPHWFTVRFFEGVAGAAVIIILSRSISAKVTGRLRTTLASVGFYSTTIYLFHTLFESTVRIGFLQIFRGVAVPFEVMALIAIVSGVIGPLILEKLVLRRFWITRKCILGVS